MKNSNRLLPEKSRAAKQQEKTPDSSPKIDLKCKPVLHPIFSIANKNEADQTDNVANAKCQTRYMGDILHLNTGAEECYEKTRYSSPKSDLKCKLVLRPIF